MTTPEQAQVGLERERAAYWAKRNEPPTEDIRPILEAAQQLLGGTSNRAAGRRAGRIKGMIRSQRHRPARRSDALVRAFNIAAANRKRRELERAAKREG